MANTIQVKRGPAANWTSTNPVLAIAEFGYETDTGKIKLGDGSTAWSALGYFAPTAPPASYTITPNPSSVDEGNTLTFNIGGANITDGTYYWTIESNAGDFTATNGSFSISSNVGSFTVTPTADSTTEGDEIFEVAIRSGSITGTILETSSSVTINDTSLNAPPTLSYLIVAGGGGGGKGVNTAGGGGGGGGGVLFVENELIQNAYTYYVTVGEGGAPGSNGNVSAFSSTTTEGGGNGGGGTDASGVGVNGNRNPGGSGGCGGGGGFNGLGGSGNAGGGNGGAGNNTPVVTSFVDYAGGGGGGAAQSGLSASVNNGPGCDGGDGISNDITGSPIVYGGGGGGGRRTNGTNYASGNITSGGNGGGGNGGGWNGSPIDPTAGQSGLGGGGGGATGNDPGASGGKGVVILRTLETASNITGSPVITTDGSYNIYKFNSDGSITF
jgi:hypothetical protein